MKLLRAIDTTICPRSESAGEMSVTLPQRRCRDSKAQMMTVLGQRNRQCERIAVYVSRWHDILMAEGDVPYSLWPLRVLSEGTRFLIAPSR